VSLRGYQVDLIALGQQAYREGAHGVLFQSSTGSGKTHMAAEGIIAPAVARGRRVLFLADLEEIILDTTARIGGIGLHVGAILDGRALDPTAPVQVASQQTLVSWLKRGLALPPCERVIVDECHGVAARTMRELLQALRGPGALLAGLTATAARGDGRPLDEFDRIVCGPQPSALVQMGALVPCEVIAPLDVLDKGVAMDPVEAVVLYASARRAIVFAPHNAEAQRIASALTALGQPTMAVLDSTPKGQRRAVRARLALWTTDRAHPDALQHLVTTRALQKGFDAPCLDVCVLTSECSIVSFLQNIGRVLRPSPETGKADALVIDLRGASLIHGLPLWDRAWSLEGGQGRFIGQDGEEIPNLRRCQECRALFAPRTVCPRCGSCLLADPRPLKIQRAEMFAASTVPLATRARGYLAGTERAMVARGMRPEKASILARSKAPQWVRDALSEGDSYHAA